jgi:NitT/TauT family transport system ATP-binding protein
MTDALRFDDLGCTFRSKRQVTVALDGVSLAVAPGEFVSLLGPSGCGKSTLLKIAAGLVAPTAGSVTLLGRPVREPQRDIGFVFQRAALLEWRSARKNILLQAEMRDLPRAKAEERADRLIEMAGLRGFEAAYPHELSGGMQQRVALCRALLHEPPILFMDEPFGALDALTREQMNVELYRIYRETGTTIVFVTHSIPEAIYLSNRVVVMTPRPGRIAEILDVGLPVERDYGTTMASPELAALADRARALLGASAHQE